MKEAPTIIGMIDDFLCKPFLHLSKIELYVFDGDLTTSNRVHYHAFRRLPPTEANTQLSQLLCRGDEFTTEANLIRVFKCGTPIGLYTARGDIHLPQAPFIFAGK